jgi:oligoribonuclease
MVGVTGLEPATSRPPAVRASQTAPHPEFPLKIIIHYNKLSMSHPNSGKKEKRYQNPEYLLWVDLEMTGLNPQKDKILEVAAIITNWDFEPLDSLDLIIHHPDETLENMNDWCKKQFKLNGLTEAVRASKITQDEAENQLLSLIDKYFAEDIPVVLAGNSIHADRAFIAEHLKKVEDRLHYRMLDVSSFKIVFQNKYKKMFVKGESHRALDDIKESIAELKFYLRDKK